jgi:hypothetical protein
VIRIVTIASLVSLLMLVLYLPSARPAYAFLAQIRSEHEVLAGFWGRAHAFGMLQTMLELQPDSPHAAPLMSAATVRPTSETKVQKEVSAVGDRLLKNEYFLSLNALVLLAMYRIAVILHLLPGIVPFFLAAVADGLVRRAIKGTDFSGHNPEVFSVCVCGAIISACLGVIACVIPAPLPPPLMPALLGGLGVFANRGLANYHKRA